MHQALQLRFLGRVDLGPGVAPQELAGAYLGPGKGIQPAISLPAAD